MKQLDSQGNVMSRKNITSLQNQDFSVFRTQLCIQDFIQNTCSQVSKNIFGGARTTRTLIYRIYSPTLSPHTDLTIRPLQYLSYIYTNIMVPANYWPYGFAASCKHLRALSSKKCRSLSTFLPSVRYFLCFGAILPK